MAAVFGSMMCQLQAGDHVVQLLPFLDLARYILKDILPKFGIEVTFVNGTNLNEWKKSVKKNTQNFLF